MSDTRPTVSVVVPVMNEAETIRALAEGIFKSAHEAAFDLIELLFIDDGSTDRTWEEICAVTEQDSRARGIRLRRNFGKASAIQLGVETLTGEIVITMDGDLQDDPQEIPRFVERILGGDDVVSGWKRVRHDPIDKTLPSKVFNWMTARASGIPLHDFNCGFKAYRREVFDSVKLYGELHRFVPVLAHSYGFKIGELEVTHHPRRFGHSKYGARRFLRGLLDLFTVMTVTRYARKPGHLFGAGGLFLGTSGVAVLGYLTVLWLLGHPIGQRPLLQLGVLLLLIGIQMLMLGLLAELMISNKREALPPSVMIDHRGGAKLQVELGAKQPDHRRAG